MHLIHRYPTDDVFFSIQKLFAKVFELEIIYTLIVANYTVKT